MGESVDRYNCIIASTLLLDLGKYLCKVSNPDIPSKLKLWIEFTAIFNERRKREKRSPTKMYNALFEKIGLSPFTLAKFYQHQKSPQRTSLDKIENWVDKEGKKKDTYFSRSNEFNDDS
ncbi:12662_t:CDS:2 [Cetraspora pellucida]|uniref:12662_t:CDS:1 n=1 Tax=Cetraspora pellucida TaxID=1433469 RepID=A0ACA9MBH4_9GLOM|nr:12662_t:CDS:2 [Cetraspora pellucida]